MSCTARWTDDRIEALTQLWRDGRSAAAIARLLGGTTRNAVIGKIHRLGLAGRAAPSRPGAGRPRSPRSEPRLRRRSPAAATPALPAIEAPALMGLADIVSIGPHSCRWPIGDPKDPRFALCGRPAVRGAYCAPHGAAAYRPTRRDHLLKLAGLV
jgi:GcrA cell cycle regulator